MPELDLPMLDLSEFDVRTEEDVERTNSARGTPGPGKVRDNAGIYVDANRVLPGGITAGEFFQMSPAGQQNYRNQRLERGAGQVDQYLFNEVLGLPGERPGWLSPLKGLTQLVNAVTSPSFSEQAIIGPPNAASKLTNALGDAIQRKPIDVSDSWLISEEAVKRVNPGRYSSAGYQAEDTPADIAGAPLGRVVGGELAGFIATGGTGNLLRRIPTVATNLGRLKTLVEGTQTARRLSTAVATGERVGRYGPRVQTVVGGANFLRDGLVSTTAATVFMDPTIDGNAANSLDGVVFDPSDTEGVPYFRQAKEGEEGIRLPGRVEEGDNYLEAWRKTVVVDGMAAPVAILGAPAAVKPVRNFLFDQNVPKFLQEMADIELAPYRSSVRNAATMDANRLTVDVPTSAAPTVDELDLFAKTTPGDLPSPGRAESIDSYSFNRAADPWDSAIDRSTAAQRQNLQVASQRTRLEQMGLQVPDGDGRYRLLTDLQDGDPLPTFEGPDGSKEIGGPNMELRQSDKQTEIDFPAEPEPDLGPDLRPELSTFLAELDELSDADLRDLLPRVSSKEKLATRQVELEQAQVRVDQLNQKIQETEGRLQLPEGSKKRLTEQGSKRIINAANKELEELNAAMLRLQAEEVAPAKVGEQLELAMNRQLDLPASATGEIELPKFMDLAWDEAAGMYRLPTPDQVGGYRTMSEYRDALEAYPRDLLRTIAAPTAPAGSPEVAAVLKARTGRRVWNAKKSDIIDAMAEVASRRKRFLEPAEQLPIEGLQQNLDLSADPALVRTGMDNATRESFKQRILQAAIDNGEVQADVTQIPTQLPKPEFNQTSLIDSLMADETGQLPLLYANDQLPTYKAGGKSAEAIVEEIRARYDWAVLDNAAQSASRRDFWTEQLYDNLTFEQKKQMAILDDDFWNPPTVQYLEPEVTPVPAKGDTPVLPERVPTPLTETEASTYAMPIPGGGELADIPAKLRNVFRWTPKGAIPEAVAEGVEKAKPKPKRVRKPKNAVEPKNAREALNNAKLNVEEKRSIRAAAEAREKLLAKRKRAEKLSKEASC
ncbi:MAG: hypothetical protein CMP83_10635 [Gammaproteobacteria bacterium]|nr:hypothetical protein [Gammaproteobacteria bacterium]